jgi:hypothetical protein
MNAHRAADWLLPAWLRCQLMSNANQIAIMTTIITNVGIGTI